jgi:hypothetical protein
LNEERRRADECGDEDDCEETREENAFLETRSEIERAFMRDWQPALVVGTCSRHRHRKW